jgi:hypothetical protein
MIPTRCIFPTLSGFTQHSIFPLTHFYTHSRSFVFLLLLVMLSFTSIVSIYRCKCTERKQRHGKLKLSAHRKQIANCNFTCCTATESNLFSLNFLCQILWLDAPHHMGVGPTFSPSSQREISSQFIHLRSLKGKLFHPHTHSYTCTAVAALNGTNRLNTLGQEDFRHSSV